MREGERIVLATYGRSSGFCIDPIEKKPLNHFHAGSSVLSFGTAGCNLGCRFCQNWTISKSREWDTLADRASPERIADAAVTNGCRSIAFTYNDPVIFAEYAIDTAAACRERGIATVAVTAGYITDLARAEFFAAMDAANVDLKGFTDDFYRRICLGKREPVLDTLRYLVRETRVWTEITTLLIPGENDGDGELEALCAFVADELGPHVPIHFTAFHPDFRMLQHPPTSLATLRRARRIAGEAGLRFVYSGNLRDLAGGVTACPQCGERLVERDGYAILAYRLERGACPSCGTPCPGVWDEKPGAWGARRRPVFLGNVA
jgi:pyruvate formate lyase activating enzyme